ncbi:MAG TPA: hypothetical protein VK386_09855 [Acidimicrobiales bacterium]|nr:hypothetical protein [Acidimicrobiales bacterium]
MNGACSPRVLVLAPMRSELRPVVRAMHGQLQQLGGNAVHVGRAGRATLTAGLIGMGPAQARRATERLLDAAVFDRVVVSGICGGIGPGSPVGDLVVPAEVEDLTTGRRFVPSTISSHRPVGVLSTTNAELILDDQRLGELSQRGTVALDMETSAVAEVCEASGIPWSVFRVVSDRADEGLLDHAVFGLLETDGSVNLGRTLRYLAARPVRVRALARLARDSSMAIRRAAAAAVAACATL